MRIRWPYAIAYTSAVRGRPIRAFAIRKAPKAHGTGQLIEGPFHSGDSVVIVEDVITTGASALRAASAVRQAGGSIEEVLAVVDRGEGGHEALEQDGLPVFSLVNAADIVAQMR